MGHSTVVRDDAVEAVLAVKSSGSGAAQHDRKPEPVPVPAASRPRGPLPGRDVSGDHGATGAERIYDGYPDVALDIREYLTIDARIQLAEYRPRVLEHPPLRTPT